MLFRSFRSRSQNKVNTELLVVVTPRFVKPIAAGQPVPMPEFPMPFLNAPLPAQSGAAGQPEFSGPIGLENPSGATR